MSEQSNPFAFVDFDEDGSEEELRPLEVPGFAKQMTRGGVSQNLHHHDRAMAQMFHREYPTNQSAPTGHPWTQPTEHRLPTRMGRGAFRESVHEETWYSGRPPSRENIALMQNGATMMGAPGGQLQQDWESARHFDATDLREAPGFGNNYSPTWHYAQHHVARAQQDGEGMPPALLNFAVENLELRAQIRSFTQEIFNLRSKLSSQTVDREEPEDDGSSSSNEWKSRYWSVAEHQRFLEGLRIYGKRNFKGIAAHVGTRSATQAKTHAQKYFARIERQRAKKAAQTQAASTSTTSSGSPSASSSGTSPSQSENLKE